MKLKSETNEFSDLEELIDTAAPSLKMAATASFVPIVLDIGANLGAVSLVAAAHGCRVILVEAQGNYVDIIQKTISSNGWTERVSVYNAVAGARTGQEIGFRDGGAFGEADSGSTRKQKVMAISDFVPDDEYDNVKLLKI